MGNMEEKRQQFKAQINEIYRLADEAESCAKLLRQQAQSHEAILADEKLTEEKLDSLLAEKPQRSFSPLSGSFIVTEGLM
jgi:hypothetical protein